MRATLLEPQTSSGSRTIRRRAARIVQTRLGEIEYAAEGSGPAVIVSHGTPGGYDAGMLIGDLLADAGCTFVAPSRPGYLGTKVSVGGAPERQADAFAALLDSLQIGEAAVVGFSGGGPAALQFALRHPQRCWAVVLISAITQRRAAFARSLSWRLAHRFVIRSRFNATVIRGALHAIPTWAIGRGRASSVSVMRNLMDTIGPFSSRETGYRNDTAQICTLAHYPLHDMDTPTLIVHGTSDGAISWVDAEAAHRAIIGSSFLKVPKGGHDCFFRSAALRAKVAAFLRDYAPLPTGPIRRRWPTPHQAALSR
jgi:pimeloyl-ACP methyl ester carboxylesterase